MPPLFSRKDYRRPQEERPPSSLADWVEVAVESGKKAPAQGAAGDFGQSIGWDEAKIAGHAMKGGRGVEPLRENRGTSSGPPQSSPERFPHRSHASPGGGPRT